MVVCKKNLNIIANISFFSMITFSQNAFCTVESSLAKKVKNEIKPTSSENLNLIFQKLDIMNIAEEAEEEFKVDEQVALVQNPEPATSEDVVEELNSRFLFGVNYTYVTFKPHGHSSFNGSLGGLQTSYEYRPANCFYGGVQFEWRDGSTHGSGGRRSFLYFDVQERLGYTLSPQHRNWFLTFFSGLGYRYTGQKLKPKHGDSVKFGYNEFYIPVGLLSNYDVNSMISCGLNFTWMPQVYPTVSIVPLKGARFIITNRLDNFLIELPITCVIMKDKRFSIVFKPSYQRWNDGHSTAKTSNGNSLGLPGNTYNYYGADLSFGYCF
ncbi:MAG: hypothetical protein V4494_02235 [Chlamydiota bacterium]